MIEKVAYKNSVFTKYPKLILLILITIISFSLLCLTEFIIGRNNYEMVQEGQPRYVTLQEPILNSENLFPTNTFESTEIGVRMNTDTFQFEADKNGFINPSFEIPESDYSIIFLGDGSTANLHLNPEDRFSFLSGKELKLKTGLKISTYNAGFPKSDITHSINRLTATILPLKPDYIVLMQTINDLKILHQNDSYWKSEKEKKVNFFSKPKENTEYTDLLLLKNIRQSVFRKTTDSLHKLNSKTLPDTALIYKNYESALETFIAICKNWKIELVLMTQANQFELLQSDRSFSPYLYQQFNEEITGEQLITIHNKLNTIIRSSAKSNNLKCIDLDKSISNQAEYFYDAMQVNSKGSELIAQIVSDSLSYLLIKRELSITENLGADK